MTGILAIIPGCCVICLPLSATGLPFSIAAMITGIIGLSKVNAAPDQFTGKGMAIAGLVCGGVGMAGSIVSFVVYVVAPNT